jgi:hypothetical protein
VKDKTQLLDARRSIEREMERFKLCEKEAKMKAFSKAALGQADKLDPREQAKAEAREWINSAVDTLNEQVRPWGLAQQPAVCSAARSGMLCLSLHAGSPTVPAWGGSLPSPAAASGCLPLETAPQPAFADREVRVRD